MANILDEQERRRKELAAQGIHTRGVAGAQGGAAEVGYVPPSRRNAPINQIPPQNASPQADYARSAEGGAMIPSEKVGQANMLASMPNQGSLTPFEQPADAWIQRSRDFTQSRVGGTNQQLETAREGIGSGRAASNRRLLEKAMQVSPEIRQSAKDRMEWRTMTPEQRRNRIGEKKLEQEAIQVKDRIEKTTSWEQMADATGTSLDSYGNSEQFYTPDQILYKRQAQREFDKEWADVLSNVDRSAFSSPQDIYQLQEQMPSVQKYGDFLGSYRFNAIRKYASPEIRAQMEADDRNQKNVKSAFLSMTREQIAEMKERLGGEYSTMGNEDFITEVWLNRDKDLAAGQVVDEVLGRTGRYTVENGRVVLDKSFAAQAEMREEERKARDDEISSELAIIRKRKEAFRQIDRIREINPERAAQMDVDDAGNLVDYSKYVPVPEAPPRELTASERIGRVKTRADANKITNEITSAAKAVQGLIPEGSEGENLVELVDAKIAELEELNSSGEMKEDGGSYEADITDLKNARNTFIQYGSDLMSLADVIIELENARTIL